VALDEELSHASFHSPWPFRNVKLPYGSLLLTLFRLRFREPKIHLDYKLYVSLSVPFFERCAQLSWAR
jgi:hypothetical protein